MYQIRHYISHDQGGCGILMILSVASHTVHKSVHDYERVDHSGDYGRCVFRSKETIHSYFHNSG